MASAAASSATAGAGCRLLMVTRATKDGIETKPYEFYKHNDVYTSPAGNKVDTADIQSDDDEKFVFFTFRTEVIYFFRHGEDRLVFAQKIIYDPDMKTLHPILFHTCSNKGGLDLVNEVCDVMKQAKAEADAASSFEAEASAAAKKKLACYQEELANEELKNTLKAAKLLSAAEIQQRIRAAKVLLEKEEAAKAERLAKKEKDEAHLKLYQEMVEAEAKAKSANTTSWADVVI